MIVKLAVALICYIVLGEIVPVYAMKGYGGVVLLLHSFFNPPTCYGLDGPWIEFRWGKIFRIHPKRQCRGPPSLLYNGYGISSPGVKRPGRGVDRQSHLAPKLKKELSCTSTPPLGFHGLF